MRAAAKRRKRVGQAGPDGRQRRSLRSPSERLTAEALRGLEAILGEQVDTPYNRDGLKLALKSADSQAERFAKGSWRSIECASRVSLARRRG